MKPGTLEKTQNSKISTLLRALIVEHSVVDVDSILLELRESGFLVEPTLVETPEEFRARIDGEIARWAPVIKAKHIKVN